MNQLIFDAKEEGETSPYVVNFSDRLVGGETINGASVTVSVFSGTDASPSSMISGTASYTTAGDVTQVLTGGIAGVVYNVAYTVTTTGSHNYVKVGYLAVIGTDPFAAS